MRRWSLVVLPVALALGACTSSPPPSNRPPSPPPSSGARPPADVPLFGSGYRNSGDLCRRAGESAYTNQFLSDSADLVACPPGTDPRLFKFETGGKEVGRRDGWILFSVPRR